MFYALNPRQETGYELVRQPSGVPLFSPRNSNFDAGLLGPCSRVTLRYACYWDRKLQVGLRASYEAACRAAE
jgi:hypothetical protein